MISDDRDFFKHTRRFELSHHGIRFFDTAEVTHTADPARRIERSVHGQFREILPDTRGNSVSVILRCTSIVAGISLYPESCRLYYFLLADG